MDLTIDWTSREVRNQNGVSLPEGKWCRVNSSMVLVQLIWTDAGLKLSIEYMIAETGTPELIPVLIPYQENGETEVNVSVGNIRATYQPGVILRTDGEFEFLGNTVEVDSPRYILRGKLVGDLVEQETRWDTLHVFLPPGAA